MQGRADGQTPAQRIPQPRDEIISSIQLIPEEQGAGSNEGTPFRRDKRGGCLVSINNFIQKTYAILQEKQFESIVSWPDEGEVSDEGQGSSFLIHNVRAFEEIVLPRYFKHSNMSSFVRQLNMYSFHKVRGDKNQIEFQHDKFIRNRPDLLAQIRRKQVDSTTSIPSVPLIPQAPSLELLKEPEPMREAVPGPNEGESLSKRESSCGHSHEQRRVWELQESNRVLRRVRQMKSAHLKQLTLENRSYVCDKFSKVLLALLATKVKQGLGGEDKSERKVENIHRVIEHIMDSSPPRALQTYLQLGEELLGSNET